MRRSNDSVLTRRVVLPISLLVGLMGVSGCRGPAVSDAAELNATEPNPAAPISVATDYFQFEMSPGLSLHHFLNEWAAADSSAIIGRRGRVRIYERTAWYDPSKAAAAEAFPIEGLEAVDPEAQQRIADAWAAAARRAGAVGGVSENPSAGNGDVSAETSGAGETMADDDNAGNGETDPRRAAWDHALLFYRVHIAGMDQFSEEFQALKNGLTEVSNSSQLAGAGLDEVLPGLTEVLESAWPVYEELWYPAHATLAREWIHELTPRVDAHEETYVRALEATYQSEWPAEPIRVDITGYSNWAGAYSSHDPNHVVMAATRPLLWGDLGLETVFHEASHSEPTGHRIVSIVRDAAEAAGVEVRRDFWHTVLFFTAGEISKRILEQEGVTDFQAYAEVRRLYQIPSWAGSYEALTEHWKPAVRMDANQPGPDPADAMVAVLRQVYNP